MEITKKHKFITDFYGSSPAKGYQNILQKYIEDRIDQELLTFVDRNKKKNQNIDEMIIDILSIFHRNGGSEPVIGAWMVKKCMLDTAYGIFNAQKNKDHPPKQMIPMAIGVINPTFINLYREGKQIEKPDGVKTYAVTIPTKPGQKGRSFFKAYEYISPACEFEITYIFDEDLVSEELANYWIQKAGQIGLGAFRERFGKFHEI